jgi:type IV pilus assembly protein PilA
MFSSAMRRLNDRRDAKGDAGADAGFTLIELMVVLLILAILLAIAIPTFLGVTKSANDRAAQSNLNTAFVNAKASFQQNSQSYGATLVASLISAEPSLSFIAAGTQLTTGTAQSTVSVQVSGDGNAVAMAVLSKSTGNCWYLVDNTQSEAASLNPTVPWSTNGVTNVATSVPTGAGTWYGEWKNVTGGTAVNCQASVPPTGVAANYSFQSTGGFPAL